MIVDLGKEMLGLCVKGLVEDGEFPAMHDEGGDYPARNERHCGDNRGPSREALTKRQSLHASGLMT